MRREYRRYLREEHKDGTRHPRGMILFVVDDDTNTISIGYSKSHKLDAFNRKLAYKISARRVASGRYTATKDSEGFSYLSTRLPDQLVDVYWDFVQHKLATP